MFARMGIKPSDRQAGRGDAELVAQRSGSDAGCLHDRRSRQCIQGVAQADMNGNGHNAQVVIDQHHHRGRTPGQCRQELGMAGMGEASAIQNGFGNRVRHHRGHAAVQYQADRAFDAGDYRSGVARVGMTEQGRDGERHAQHRQSPGEHRGRLVRLGDFLDRAGQPRGVVQRQKSRTGAAEARVSGSRNLTPDTGRVAHGEGDHWHGDHWRASDMKRTTLNREGCFLHGLTQRRMAVADTGHVLAAGTKLHRGGQFGN